VPHTGFDFQHNLYQGIDNSYGKPDYMLTNNMPLNLTTKQKNSLPTIPADSTESFRESIINLFLTKLRNDDTRKAYKRVLSDFLGWLQKASLPLALVKAKHVALYVEELLEGKSIATVKQSLSIIRSFFNHLSIDGIVENNPALQVKAPKLSRRVGATPGLTRRQVRKLLNSIDRSTLRGKRNYAILCTFLFTGARLAAVSRLKVKDFYAIGERRYLKFRDKNSVSFDAPCHPVLFEALESWLAVIKVEPNKSLFQSLNNSKGLDQLPTGRPLTSHAIYQLVKRLVSKAGMKSISPHSFRVAAANSLHKSGADIEMIRKFLNHSSADTTRLYLRGENLISYEDYLRISY